MPGINNSAAQGPLTCNKLVDAVSKYVGQNNNNLQFRPDNETMWCAAFASKIAEEAFGASPWGYTAASWDVMNWGKANGRWETDMSKIQPGDFILYKFPDDVAMYGAG